METQESTDRILRSIGPLDANTGFVHDFVSQTNEHDMFMYYDGDVIDMKLKCEGFNIDPVVLTRITEETSEESWRKRYPRFATTVILKPENTGSQPTPSDTITVEGLTDKDNKTLAFTLSLSHPLSECISYDDTTGIITLDVDFNSDMGDDDRSNAIFVDETFQYYHFKMIKTPFLEHEWDKYELAPVTEGVVFMDNVVPEPLSVLLNEHISHLAASTPVDWHPGSNDCVRDLVHPSLYPFVRGESPTTSDADSVLGKIDKYNEEVSQEEGLDRWGRKFEVSKYQWIPTIFNVDEEGAVDIEGYINNLDRNKYGHLYSSLANLFQMFLPHFETIYAYAKALKFAPAEDDYDGGWMDIEREYNPDMASSRLRGTQLRVITKIVDYELKNTSDAVEGVYHVEGMSTDHIIMTGIFIVDRDPEFHGGDLTFRRSFLDFEGSYIFEQISQSRHWRAEQIVEENIRPLGTLATPKGRMIVFPNSHIHKLSKMTRIDTSSNEESAGISRRRVVVFWVVDPEREVVCTREVPIQQERTMTEEKAREHRTALMEERKRHKTALNGERKISLCEH